MSALNLYPELNAKLEEFDAGLEDDFVVALDTFFKPENPGPNDGWEFEYFPDGNKEKAFLGQGSFGKVYRAVRDSADPSSPICACKVLLKSKIEGNKDAMKDLVLELAVLKLASKHRYPHLNKISPTIQGDPQTGKSKVQIFHDTHRIYLPLEMTTCSSYMGNPSCCRTLQPTEEEKHQQLLYIFAKYYPEAIETVSVLVESVKRPEDFIQKVSPEVCHGMQNLTILCQHTSKPKLEPHIIAGPQGSLWDLMYSHLYPWMGGVPELMAKIIIKQCLDAVSWLHSKGIAHRDIKPNNILFGENRHVELLYENESVDAPVIGARLVSSFDIQLIDYGFVKLLALPEGSVQQASTADTTTTGNGTTEEGSDDDTSSRGGPPPPSVSRSAGTASSTTTAGPSSSTYVSTRRWFTRNKSTTEFSPFDVITMEIEQVGNPQGKNWISTDEDIMKIDVHSIGVTLYMLLFGSYPYPAPNDKERQHMIDEVTGRPGTGEKDLSDEQWKLYKKRELCWRRDCMSRGPIFPSFLDHGVVSEECRDFIRCLLQNEAKDRLSVAAALNHPWLKDPATNGVVHDPEAHGEKKTVCKYVSERFTNGRVMDSLWWFEPSDEQIRGENGGQSRGDLPRTPLSLEKNKTTPGATGPDSPTPNNNAGGFWREFTPTSLAPDEEVNNGNDEEGSSSLDMMSPLIARIRLEAEDLNDELRGREKQ